MSDSGSEQVLPGYAPKYLPACSCSDPGAEESGRGTVYGPVASAGNLVQRAKCEAAAWKALVEVTDSKRKDGFLARNTPFDPFDRRAQCRNGACMFHPDTLHPKFSFCSR